MPKNNSIVILGIDPGTATTGFGIIKIDNKKNTIEALDYGTIKTDKIDLMPVRLHKIYNSIHHLIEKYEPDMLSIELLFFNTNAKTAIAVGQSRGVVMLAAGQKKISVFEYTALQAKMCLTGYGRAEKEDVRTKVSEMLAIKETIKPIDASDALAIALCHYIKTK